MMQRVSVLPRENWQQIVESQGLHYHSLSETQVGQAFQPDIDDVQSQAGKPDLRDASHRYWDETACYQFTAAEIDALEACTYALNEHCLRAAEHIITHNLFDRVGIPASHVDLVRRSWEQDEHTIYGRFDLCYDGTSSPRLLEYNADTPTALLEAAVIQWFWMKDWRALMGSETAWDQFNSIHERLLEVFQSLRQSQQGRFYFAAVAGNLEDFMTVNYLRDVAMQSGWDTAYINVEDIGWNEARREFTDLDEKAMRLCFKLYPWEWMAREQFGPKLLIAKTRWWEPPWKMLLSNKGLLPILYRLFPDSPYLVPASFDPLLDTAQIRKPRHGREGANVTLLNEHGQAIQSTPGPYEGPFVYQQYCPLPEFAGNHPVIGSWIVNGYACGIGIREDTSPITTNRSRFVPHVFKKDAASEARKAAV